MAGHPVCFWVFSNYWVGSSNIFQTLIKISKGYENLKYALFKNIQKETDLTTSDDDTDDGNSSAGSSVLSERTINRYSRFFRYWNKEN